MLLINASISTLSADINPNALAGPFINISKIVSATSSGDTSCTRNVTSPLCRLYFTLPTDYIFAEGIKEVLFFSYDVMNYYSMVLICIVVGGFILLCLKNLISKPYNHIHR